MTRKHNGLLFIVLAAGILCIHSQVLAFQGHGGPSRGFWELFTLPRVWMSFVFGGVGLGLLLKSRVSRNIRIAVLAVVFFAFGFLPHLNLGAFAKGMGMHPSPMCLVEKAIIILKNSGSLPVTFLTLLFSVALLSIIGNKLFCGWVCPVGAMQELINEIPLTRRWKKTVPFSISNAVRISVFVLFLVLLFSSGLSVYAYGNPFEFFHFQWETVGIIAVAVTAAASLFLFRPFCYFLCPLGLVTWVLEQLSIFRIIKTKECTDCTICEKEAHCPGLKTILENKRVRGDCFSCGRCLRACPGKHLEYTGRLAGNKPGSSSSNEKNVS